MPKNLLRLTGEKILWLFSEQQKIKSNLKRQSHELNGKTASNQTLLKIEESKDLKFTFLGRGWGSFVKKGLFPQLWAQMIQLVSGIRSWSRQEGVFVS